MGMCALVLLLGIAGICLVFLAGQHTGGMIAGAIGLVAGGYAINIANRSADNRIMFVAIAGTGLLLSVIAFMIGLKGMV